jgi:hypothetical protein
MTALGEKARTELKESCEMVLEIEREGLRLRQSETERRYRLIMNKLRRKKD